LLWRSLFIDNRHYLAPPFVDRPWPGKHGGNLQAVQFCVAMLTFIDVNGEGTMTIAMGRPGVELTRASVVAVTMYDLTSFERPLDIDHGSSPFHDV
jgi:hypothetical protein